MVVKLTYRHLATHHCLDQCWKFQGIHMASPGQNEARQAHSFIVTYITFDEDRSFRKKIMSVMVRQLIIYDDKSHKFLTMRLTYQDQVIHECTSELGQHWFKKQPCTNLVLSHYLNQCWLLLIRSLGTNLSEILFKSKTVSFKKIHLKMSSWHHPPFWWFSARKT